MCVRACTRACPHLGHLGPRARERLELEFESPLQLDFCEKTLSTLFPRPILQGRAFTRMKLWVLLLLLGESATALRRAPFSLSPARVTSRSTAAATMADAPRVYRGKILDGTEERCTEPVPLTTAVVPLLATTTLAYYGFNTKVNRDDSEREGQDPMVVPRRRALTWLGLQCGAAFFLGPQVTNPCSNINQKRA